MAHQPRNYETLREDHQQALDALNAHIEQGQQPAREGPSPAQAAEREAAQEVTAHSAPERPEGHYGDRHGWDSASMPNQQRAALDMAKDHHEHRQEQTTARDALDQHMQGGGSQTPEQNQDLGRKPDDIER